ncbi:MAG: hypothetical protein AB7N80_03275 [Bdellovibrionales bacterium]
MEQLDQAPLKKALTINLDPHFYGTFAEIGAGQEVARYFFVAGKASQTIAKTISAYDMTFSDSIYGRTGRYVCEERVLRMLSHEFDLLKERLDTQRGAATRFFAMADTVATSSQGEPSSRCHGWMGVRFQLKPRGPSHDIILHVRLKDRARLQQQEALGILGVNMVALAHQLPLDRHEFLDRLTHGLNTSRLEINLLRVLGPDAQQIDNRLLNLEMVRRGIAEAVLFEPSGHISNPSDVLFKKSVLVQRGTFRPVTNVNVMLLERGLKQFKNEFKHQGEPEVLFELTMNNLTSEGQLQESDFLDRVDTICALGHKVLLSNFNLFYQVKSFLRTYTDQPLALIVGAAHLEKLFATQYYDGLSGGILEGFSRLFDDKTRILVFPFKSQNLCQTAATFNPPGSLAHLYHYLMSQKLVVDILGCDDVDTTMHSKDVRTMLASGDKAWEKLVPAAARDLIRSRKMFGAKA